MKPSCGYLCANYLANGICMGSESNELVDTTGELKCFKLRTSVDENLISSKIKDVTYTNLPSGKSIVCEITLQNGFTVRGEASVVSKENFVQEVGNEIAYKNAYNQIWMLEGYLLQEELYRKDNK